MLVLVPLFRWVFALSMSVVLIAACYELIALSFHFFE